MPPQAAPVPATDPAWAPSHKCSLEAPGFWGRPQLGQAVRRGRRGCIGDPPKMKPHVSLPPVRVGYTLQTATIRVTSTQSGLRTQWSIALARGTGHEVPRHPDGASMGACAQEREGLCLEKQTQRPPDAAPQPRLGRQHQADRGTPPAGSFTAGKPPGRPGSPRLRGQQLFPSTDHRHLSWTKAAHAPSREWLGDRGSRSLPEESRPSLAGSWGWWWGVRSWCPHRADWQGRRWSS